MGLLMRTFKSLLCVICIASPVFAETSVPISQGMQGIASVQCINKVQMVENSHIPPELAHRTHPIVAPNNPKDTVFSALTVLDYRGDDSHISITTIPTSSGCSVVYMEHFSIPEPCSIAREQVFKKWNFIGKMRKTLVFSFRRDTDFFGYLTDQGLGKYCLVTKRKVYF